MGKRVGGCGYVIWSFAGEGGKNREAKAIRILYDRQREQDRRESICLYRRERSIRGQCRRHEKRQAGGRRGKLEGDKRLNHGYVN